MADALVSRLTGAETVADMSVEVQVVMTDRTLLEGADEPAPVRHADHVVAHAENGPTSAANAQGLCARGNYTKQQRGWRTSVVDQQPHTVESVTPTGHRYRSQAPPVLPVRTDITDSPLERAYSLLLAG